MTDRETLLARIKALAAERHRVLVAVCGPPGSGKSTLAESLAADLGEGAVVMPMDGFHLDNEVLIARDLLARKGAPQTFDAAGFVALVAKVKAGGEVSYPTFDRTADATVPGGGRLDAASRIILIEGNYLLLDTPPWDQLAPLFDLSVALEVPREVLEARLIRRWVDHGHSPSEAEARANGNDMQNADLVATQSRRPDAVLPFSERSVPE